MLAITDGGELGEAATGCEKRWRGVAEPERRELRELTAEIEGELGTACDHGVDRGHRLEVVFVECCGRLPGEGLRERLDVLLRDRQAGCCPMAAPAPEQPGARAERG